MPLSPLRGNPLLTMGTDDPNERADRLTQLANSNRTALGAGAMMGAEGITAGNVAAQALDAEIAGDPNASPLRQMALQGGQRATDAMQGHIGSYKDVHGVGDALDFAASQMGQAGVTTLPPLAAALLTRGAGRLAGPGAFIGAAIPAYQMEKGEAVLNQYQDPTTANADPRLRLRAAQGKGLANAALESIVPAGLASGFGHAGASALGTIGKSIVEEGLTEGTQEGVGQIAQEAVRQGGLNHAALVAPLDPKNREAQINAAIAGGLGGGGLSMPTAASQGVANAVVAAKDAAVDTAKTGAKIAAEAVGKTGDLAQSLGGKLKDFSDEQINEHITRHGAEPTLVPDSPAEHVLKTSTDPAEIMQAQEAVEAGLEPHANEVAQNVVQDKTAPPSLKERAAQVLAGNTPREALSAFVDEVRGIDTTRAQTRIKDTATTAIDKASTMVKSFLDTPLPGVKRSDEEVDHTAAVAKLFEGLDPEFKADPAIRSRLEPLAKVLHTMESVEEPTRQQYALLQDMHDKGVFNLFVDPSKALGFGLQKALTNVTRARSEALQNDSWFTTGLAPAFQSNPKVRTELAKVVDRAALAGYATTEQKALLARAFGSAKNAKAMLDHYTKLMPKLEGKIAPAQAEGLDEEHVVDPHDTQSMTQVAPKDTKIQHHFATLDEQPYLGVEKTERGLLASGKEGDITPARKAAKLLRDKDPSRRVRVQNMLDYARETGKDPGELAAKLRENFAKREEAGTARPFEAVLHEAHANDDTELLRSHEVLRSEQADNARGVVFDNDPELHAKARTLVDNVRHAKTPEAADAMRATHFKVYRKVVNSANEIVERPTTYSAESLWKYFGDKQQAKIKAEGGKAVSESEGQRAQNLFAQAIAEIAQDRNVTKITGMKKGSDRLPSDLVLDRKNKVTLAKDLRVTTKELKTEKKYDSKRKSDNPRWLDTLQQAEYALNDSAIPDIVYAKQHSDDPRKALTYLQRVLDIPRGEVSKTPAGFRQLAMRLKRDELVRKAMREMVDDEVPKPNFRTLTDAEKADAGASGYEEQHNLNLAKLDEQEHYVRELSELVHGLGQFETMLDRAQETLEKFEAAVDKSARKYDEFTGDALVPGDKDAGHFASGFRGQVKDNMLPTTAPERAAQPAVKDKVAKPTENLDKATLDAAGRQQRQANVPGPTSSKDGTPMDARTPAQKHAARMAEKAKLALPRKAPERTLSAEEKADLAARAIAGKTKGLKFSMEATKIHEQLGREGFAASHDSPHRFDGNFNWREHAYKGEGAMAYGAGTYLSTSDGVHRAYKEKFTAQSGDDDWYNTDKAFEIRERISDLIRQGNKLVVPARNAPASNKTPLTTDDLFAAQVEGTDPYGSPTLVYRAFVTKAEAEKEAMGKVVPFETAVKDLMDDLARFDVPTVPSPTYQVSVKANDDELMDWDAPFNEQTPAIQKKLLAALEPHRDTYLVQNLLTQIDLGAARMPTGKALYQALANSIGDREASDAMQEAGIVGHKYAANGGRNDEHPNYVIYDDSRITTNAVTFSKEDPKGDPLKIDQALKDQIKAEITRILGKDVKLSFNKGLLGSGDYNPATRRIRLALAATNPLATAYHESLHDFFNTLSGSEKGRQLRAGLMAASSTESVRKQLAEIFKNSPGALAQIESDAEERAAYAFQLWALGKNTGTKLITIGPAGQNIFTKIATFIRQLTGVVSQDERAERVFNALYDGSFSKPSEVGAVIHDMGLLTLGEKLRAISGPLAEVSDKLMLVSTDRLRALGHAATDQLADEFMKEPGRESGGAAFLPRRAQRAAQYKNKVAKLFDGTTVLERTQALRNLQAMKAPSSPLEQGIRDLLDELHAYQTEAKVMQFDPKTKKWDKPLPKAADYFPRVWDGRKILNNEAAFRDVLQQHGVSLAQSIAITKAVTHGDGQIDLALNEYHVGYTPFAAAVENRALTFIDRSNAADFVDFQSGDMASVLSTYINQAVHRAEFARQFGNAGEKIDDAINAASDKLDAKQIAEARTAVKALVGTLGADINPRSKEMMSAAITAENLILLPLTMFSQVIDAVGVGLRANKANEAWTAMGYGFKQIGKQIARMKDDDYDTQMAKTLGLIEDASVADVMGETYAGSNMSTFARKANRQFFKWNGMEAWNRGMRVAAMVAGERFVIREAANDRYMRELGLTQADIMPLPNGRLAVTADQMRTVDPKLDPAEAAERELRVQEALFRFVDGAVLRPNAANRPVWGSDPHWMLMFHLKQFSFTFQKTILARVGNEMDNGNVMPAALLAAYVPVIMASSALKATLTGTTIGDGSMTAALMNGINRSGILGARSFTSDAATDLARGQIPGTSFLGPALQHVWMAGRWAVGDPQTSTADLVQRSIPLGKYLN